MRVILSSITSLILCSSFLVTPAPAAPDEWYTYRYNSARTGAQPYASDLSDPAKVGTLEVGWGFPPTSNGVGEFKTSPIVVDDTVFIGSVNGYFYALDAATGALKWQYPKAGEQALLGSCDPGGFAGGIGHYGIQSSATFAVIGVSARLSSARLIPPLHHWTPWAMGGVARGFLRSRSRQILITLSQFGKVKLLRTSIVHRTAFFMSG
jgi:hypothetical protein